MSHWPYITASVVLYIWAQGIGMGDEHLPMLSSRVWSTLPFSCPSEALLGCHLPCTQLSP